jgi:hypothetical protein
MAMGRPLVVQHTPNSDGDRTLCGMNLVHCSECTRREWTRAVEVPDYGRVTLYRSEQDGSLVVEIDTPDAAGERWSGPDDVPYLRVHVNDGLVWANGPDVVGDKGKEVE